MKPKFKHFVIIKFDYPEGYPFFDLKSQQLRWTCLETLRNQTCKEFVMVFNSTAPMPHEGFGELIISPCWKDKVREAAKDYEYIITTRLDGDDFVSPDFIQTIHDNFQEIDKLILAPNGWIYDSRVDQASDNWTWNRYVMNCFSFIERTNNIKTCYEWAHSKIKKYHPVYWIEKKIHIWCINLESLKACTKPSEYYIKGPDRKGEIIELHPERYSLMLDRIIKFNKLIKKLKEDLKKDWRKIWKKMTKKET